VFGLVSAIYGNVPPIKMTYGYSCPLLGIVLAEINQTKKEELKVHLKKKERRK
jgi:hypothetical protein